ncbi:hypothetical protein Q5H92_24690 [Hymenobacter sp. M29]|uniref:DUF4760 domain-containing protein n=1 Tax=Hymenobacter mellowenesis TaxID=3063995 RepID=A0ABT9AI82_9BACT|nr:hypothetical protein [Hymenobacter sp. M29]MDO7849583.1 hypothetical protein [Hymenobacter sp. M29]
MDYVYDNAGYLFWGGLLVLVIISGVLRYVKNRRSPYHTQLRDRKRRLIEAEEKGDYRSLQQILLECKWLEMHERDARFSYSYRHIDATHREIEANSRTIYASIDAEKMVLPNASNVAKLNKYECHSFFNELVFDYRKALANSSYNGNFFFPEKILPYPKQYLLFALDKLIAVESGKDDYATLREYLVKNCIGMLPMFLPVDRELNKKAGEQYLAAINTGTVA